jgi:hypothetical protein
MVIRPSLPANSDPNKQELSVRLTNDEIVYLVTHGRSKNHSTEAISSQAKSKSSKDTVNSFAEFFLQLT